jgi:hypothetical protein
VGIIYIHEAVKQALEKKCWIIDRSREFIGEVAIEPTHKRDCCVIHFLKKPDMKPAPKWNPDAEDLMSGSWELYER